MTDEASFSAFQGERRLAAGPWGEVAAAARGALQGGRVDPVLIFDDRTGRVVDLDPRGHDIEAQSAAPPRPAPAADAARGRGRPKLGVTAREVTLLPRQWEWLAAQPGGASATLRRLVDQARSAGGPAALRRQAQEAADRFMRTMLGNQPGYEEASRALYRGEKERFAKLVAWWPHDLREHVLRLAAGAF